MGNKGIYKTSPATPGLFNLYTLEVLKENSSFVVNKHENIDCLSFT